MSADKISTCVAQRRHMSFNQYSIYSVISSAGVKNEQEICKALEIADKFNCFKNPNSVKIYLEKELNCENGKCNVNGCLITTKEDKELLLVNMTFGNENYRFYYHK